MRQSNPSNDANNFGDDRVTKQNLVIGHSNNTSNSSSSSKIVVCSPNISKRGNKNNIANKIKARASTWVCVRVWGCVCTQCLLRHLCIFQVFTGITSAYWTSSIRLQKRGGSKLHLVNFSTTKENFKVKIILIGTYTTCVRIYLKICKHIK